MKQHMETMHEMMESQGGNGASLRGDTLIAKKLYGSRETRAMPSIQ